MSKPFLTGFAAVGISLVCLVRAPVSADSQARTEPPAQRVVHFPRDRLLGRLAIVDPVPDEPVDSLHPWNEGLPDRVVGYVQGDTIVPGRALLSLSVWEPAGYRDLSPLSRLDPNDLYKLTIDSSRPGGPKPDDRSMAHIADLTGLRVLGLYNTNVGNEGLRLLTRLKNLRHLAVPPRVDDEGLAHLAELPGLRTLYLSGSRITDRGLGQLAKLPLLEELHLFGEAFGDDSLVPLANLPKLRYLKLRGRRYTDAGLAHLRNIPALRILHLGFLRQITDSGLVHLAEFPQLERLSLHWNENVTDTGIAHLARLSALKELDLYHAAITDRAMLSIKQMDNLESLMLSGFAITDAGMSHVVALPKLKRLWAPGSRRSPLTDTSLRHITTLASLEELVTGGEFTDEGMRHVAGLTNLRKLSFSDVPGLTNKGLAYLSALPSLQSLRIGKSKVTVSGLSCLNALGGGLTLLSVYRPVQDGGRLDLADLTGLWSLDLYVGREGTWQDEDLACLARLTRLERLCLSSGGLSSVGLRHISGLTNLDTLSIGGENVADEGLVHLRDLKKLRRLILTGSFTDKAFEHLTVLTNLEQLDITSANAFNPVAVRAFRQEMPHLHQYRDRRAERAARSRPQTDLLGSRRRRTPKGTRRRR